MDDAYKLDATADAEKILLGIDDSSKLIDRPVSQATEKAISEMVNRVSKTTPETDLMRAEAILKNKTSCYQKDSAQSLAF